MSPRQLQWETQNPQNCKSTPTQILFSSSKGFLIVISPSRCGCCVVHGILPPQCSLVCPPPSYRSPKYPPPHSSFPSIPPSLFFPPFHSLASPHPSLRFVCPPPHHSALIPLPPSCKRFLFNPISHRLLPKCTRICRKESLQAPTYPKSWRRCTHDPFHPHTPKVLKVETFMREFENPWQS